VAEGGGLLSRLVPSRSVPTAVIQSGFSRFFSLPGDGLFRLVPSRPLMLGANLGANLG